MIHRSILSGLALAGLAHPAAATSLNARLDLEPLIVKHAKANNVPAALVHRVIIRESRYNAGAVGRGGALGLMQIKHGTARALGYSGPAAGLLDADTNLTYGVRYLAGAYRVAGGDQNQAVGFYARGYYYDAKRKGMLGALAKAQPAVEEPAAVAAAPQPQQPPSIFSVLFSAPPQPQPAAQAQVAVEEPEAPVAPARRKRSQAQRAAPTAAITEVSAQRASAADTITTAPGASLRGPEARGGSALRVPSGAAMAGPDLRPARRAGEDSAPAVAEAQAPALKAVKPRSRSAGPTAASDAGRSEQKASAQPGDPGKSP